MFREKKEENLELVKKHCKVELERLYKELVGDKPDKYHHAGGYSEYKANMGKVKVAYKKNFIDTDKSTVQEVMNSFLNSESDVENQIMHSDQKLSEDERKEEIERIQKENAEAQKLQKEEFERQRQEDRRRNYEQLKRIEAERAEFKKRQDDKNKMMIEQWPKNGRKDLTDWEHVISLLADKDAIFDESLIEKLGFPTQGQLNRLEEIYLKTKSKIASDLLKNVEISICKFVTSKHKSIKYAWLAGVLDINGDVRVQLVIEVENNSEEIKIQDVLYDPFIIQHNVFSEEAKFMMTASEHYDEITLSDLRSIQMCINKQAKRLMEDHKHLSIINASSTKSKGFNTPGGHRIIEKTCIVFYVRKKGLIPVGEEPFADKLDEYPTDVREGVFYAGMETEGEETLKMGCTIVKKHTTDDGREHFNYGTLGGFIDHPEYGICGLTCAHVLLDENERQRLHAEQELTWLNFHTGDIDVYLNTEPKIKIGRLTKAILTTGDEGSHGMDAAIFQIEKLFPNAGRFVNELTQEENPVHFDTGKVFGSSRCSSDLRVFKYGSTTGKTVGKFVNAIPFINVRFHARPFLADMMNRSRNTSINFHNQIEIKSINNTVFSDEGDSGSLLMTEGQNGDLFCMGIVEGHTTYYTSIITPIGPILEKMNVSSLKCFEEEQMRETVRRLEETTRQTNLQLHEFKNEILSAINDLRQSIQHGAQQTDMNDSRQATRGASFDNAHSEPRHTDQRSVESSD